MRLAARLCLLLGQAEQALAHSTEAIRISGGVASEYLSESYLYSHAQVLKTNDQTVAAQDYLQRAHQRVMQVADQTQDATLRQSWLENVPTNRDIIKNWRMWGVKD